MKALFGGQKAAPARAVAPKPPGDQHPVKMPDEMEDKKAALSTRNMKYGNRGRAATILSGGTAGTKLGS